MNKINASMIICALAIMLIAVFAISANAQLAPGTNLPSMTGFSRPGAFQTGVQNLPGGFNPLQQQGQGITYGEPAPTGGQQCYCIRAPCNCPGSAQGGPLSLPAQPNLNQPFQAQNFPNQRFQPLSAPAGQAGSAAFGNVAGTGVRPL
jgi:hypothetical protein